MESRRGSGCEIQGFDHYDKADTFTVDRAVKDVSIDDYDALVIPGGVGNPDTMRSDEDAVRFVRAFVEDRVAIGAISHAPWMIGEMRRSCETFTPVGHTSGYSERMAS